MTEEENVIYNRHSTRCFDAEFEMGKTEMERILQAGIRAPSPKNRQPWSFVVLNRRQDILRITEILREQIKQLKRERTATGRDFDDLTLAENTADILQTVSALVFVCYLRDGSKEHGDSMEWSLTAQPFEVTDIQSIGACIENMLLCAQSMGISSLWICDVLYAEEAISKELRLKDPFIAAVAFGKAAVHQSSRIPLCQKVTWLELKP